MGRPLNQHIDNRELNALVPWSPETAQEPQGISSDALREAERHVLSCLSCSRKVAKYWQLVIKVSNVLVPAAAPPGTGCPKDDDVDWHEVATGLWPESKASQLILHAALCDHCGPLLRAATSVNDGLAAEEKLPVAAATSMDASARSSHRPWKLTRWLVPAMALVLIAGLLHTKPSSSSASLLGPKFAEFAVSTHRQYAQGSLMLDVRSSSQESINEWLKRNVQFSMALPVSPPIPGEERPGHLQGARLVQVGGKNAAFLAYQMRSGAVSLMVAPDSVAVASGGVAANFKKVSFHYAMVDGYKVVTWSSHGLTYALSSEEGNGTQQSCMICHSAMRDRDLSKTPTPLYSPKT